MKGTIRQLKPKIGARKLALLSPLWVNYIIMRIRRFSITGICFLFLSFHINAQELNADEIISISDAKTLEIHKILTSKGYNLARRNFLESTYNAKDSASGLIYSVTIGESFFLIRSPNTQNANKLLQSFKILGYDTTQELVSSLFKRTTLRKEDMVVEFLTFPALGFSVKLSKE